MGFKHIQKINNNKKKLTVFSDGKTFPVSSCMILYFYHAGDWALAQVTERSCGVCLLADFPKPSGHRIIRVGKDLQDPTITLLSMSPTKPCP